MRRLPLRRTVFAALAFSSAACARPSATASTPAATPASGAVRVQDVRTALFDLAADSMQGRRTGTEGGMRAAVYLSGRLRAMGVEPAGDMGYYQVVPIEVDSADPAGRRLRLTTMDALARLPAGRARQAYNVVARIPGSDPALASEAVIVGAHYDHLGIGRAENGDSIYNGADDDASGTVAVLEIARALRARPARRTVILFFATGEEVGMLGTRWYLQHPVVPIEQTAAGLFVEMIGRPDSLAGGPGRGWLTGFDRSTVGASLAAAGVPLVPDPRPAQNFFERSDNTPFARVGVPAHVISSFNLHTDYHHAGDEAGRIDYPHVAALTQAAITAVRTLADGPRPQWNPGGRPAAPR
ncbi:M20/M25/M40 family metallo-hydrolase [Longimicrobium terrae]|uniref:Peptidase M28 domain-containing protein n=2 Tax=Longimicrobium terrae TaxID=1639882 RepID=A0A841H2V3_9BACT|nr:M20/M25/M40 family metallo-hydrolase [Longimicrobium terrae]MBB6072179.1 hypothetical protein [Longimicrobium terrae]NNC28395.1 M20/M25/M40 family metallo-hydrolase [Longimicrobium terrae]